MTYRDKDIYEESKPWEDGPTGPAPKNQPVFISVDLFAIGRWLRRKFNGTRKTRNTKGTGSVDESDVADSTTPKSNDNSGV
jgi:hypothetical protein